MNNSNGLPPDIDYPFGQESEKICKNCTWYDDPWGDGKYWCGKHDEWPEPNNSCKDFKERGNDNQNPTTQ
ncbi:MULTISPECIES: hypothetical protein [unclassified Nitratiruptor]|uniref:hypothetical protein n=1 Tax=unclassified Nitratiruptor TaxID=2624044 RepID=UPI0019162461|nr:MULTISPECIES: hypothetical protein [unclassified Nitratiruptor]